MKRRPLHPAARAFTLIEVVLASAITAILLLAVQSVIMLAAHAVPGAQSKSTTLTGAAGTLADLDSDLAFATSISSRTATAVTFQVPDRNSDGLPETITWSWDGTLGGTLYRTFNSGTPVAMATNVQAFSLAYDTRTALGTSTPNTAAETLLASNALVTGLLAPPVNSQNIDKKKSFGQYIFPTLPANATAWSVTRVQLMLKGNNQAAACSAQLFATDPSDLPTSTLVDQAAFDFSTVPSTFGFVQFNFTQANNLTPGTGIAVVISNPSKVGNAGSVESQNISVGGVANILSTPDGVTWSQAPNANLLYYLYGTVTSPNPPPTLYYLTGVRAAAPFHGSPNHRPRHHPHHERTPGERTMTRLRPDTFARPGFTMVEATISVAILGILLVVALQVVGASMRNQYHTAQRLTAASLAQSLLNDIIQLPYQDPGAVVNFGIEPGETAGSKANYDDVDDFNNWTESPPQDRTGSPMTDLAGWTRSVTVAWVNPANITQTLLTESGVKRITVTVSKGGAVLATRSALRGKY